VTIAAVVTAAGAGTRLGTVPPKALVLVGDRSLVAHAVDRVSLVAGVVVVTAPSEHLLHVADAVGPSVIVVAGGASRQESVAAGLAALAAEGVGGDDIVLIHDAARAFMPVDVMRRAVAAVEAGADGAVPVLPIADTLVTEAEGAYGAVADRGALRAVQTPQVFRARVIMAAHDAAGADAPDDATLAVSTGARVVLVEGDARGHKVTYEGDLALAEFLAAQ
jgi:2-C-methyl-D-erythritol 4-phosphate cytidylyltransferase